MAIRTTQNMSPAGTTHYVYDLAGHLIAEATDTGSTVREYVWFDDMPLAAVADVDTVTPHLYYVHADHLDRPIVMTDGSKAVVWEAVYKPFGEVQSITGSASNNLRFPGQYFLLESGLHYNWHRHYDPTIGRYLQPDPLDFVDGPSVDAYARSAPGMYVDSNGQLAWWVIPAAFAAGDFAWQMYQNGGNVACVDWGEVAGWAISGIGINRTGWAYARSVDFIVSAAGKVIGIPPNYIGQSAENGRGVIYAPRGSTGNADTIRIMGPNSQNPSGYVRIYNEHGQPINPVTGKPGPQGTTHTGL